MNRRRLVHKALLPLAIPVVLTALPALARTTVTSGLVIDHVTVVDVRTGRKLPDRAVVVSEGRIATIVRGGSVRARGTAQVVQGQGAFVVPGFNDMHAHNLNTASPETSLPLMVAYGITGFRQMAPVAPNFAKDSEGRLVMPPLAPRVLGIPGRLLAGPAYASPDQARAEVERQHAAGADFIKVVDLPPAAFVAAAEEARARGLGYAGHLSPSVAPHEAIARGMTSIEHLGPTISLLLSCSSDEAAIRARMAAAPQGGGGVDFDAGPAALQRLLANPVLAAPPQALLVSQRVIATYDEARCQKLASDIAASQVWVVPTLTRLEAMNRGNDPELRNNPNLRLIPAPTRDLWLSVGDDFDRKLTVDQRTMLAGLFERQLRLAGLLDAAGAKLLAGTDFGGQWIVPGQSIHREFDLLARAGISPLHILQMATINPALYLRREFEMGSVLPGRAADLVLLAGDPTASVANLHRITGVVRAGRWLGREELDRIVAEAERQLSR